MAKNKDITVLTGDEARRAMQEIVDSMEDDGKTLHFPKHIGVAGYFAAENDYNQSIFAAFDNSSGDYWCEDFKTQEGAEKWCRGELSADEVREMESNVEKITLSLDSFPASKEKGFSQVADLPPYVKFNKYGEFALDMQFHDGYALDTNRHGLGFYDRIGLYYPTVDEVAKSPDMQEEIESYTGRRWAEGSAHEKIFDIALKYGKASRVKCPSERYDAAVKAIVERAADPSAKAFTPEQRAKLELAVDCNGYKGYPEWRETFFDNMFGVAQQQMQRVPIAWAADAHKELKELAHGEVRDQGLGLRR